MNYKSSFTMAEVLITLGIIGIIAAMTLPALINKYQEVQFKSAYKKAYADLSMHFNPVLLIRNLPELHSMKKQLQRKNSI